MTCVMRGRSLIFVLLVCLVGGACQLKRPETIPGRMIEPQLLAPQAPAPAAPGERSDRSLNPVARYPGAWTHWPPGALPTTRWRAHRRPRVAMVIRAGSVPGHGTPP